jgi:hypothetical protein
MNALNMMKRWLALVEIEAESVLPEGAPPFKYRDPHDRYTVQLSNRAVCPLADIPLLALQLEFTAPDIATADAQLRPLVREFLHWLALITHSSFRIGHVERLVDWTPGLTEREMYAYHADRTEMPPSIVRSDLADTLALLNSEECPAEVRRAIRWFAEGLAADLRDDQFQCFFFAIEILAEYHKATEKVPDRCPVCRNDLYCQKCGSVPLHRPYAKQAIRDLLVRLLPKVGEQLFELLDTVRNRTMHGHQIDEIEAQLDVSFSDVVDKAGRAAYTCIMHSLRLPIGRHSLFTMTATTFVRPQLVAMFHVTMNLTSKDPMNPQVSDLPRIDVSTERLGPNDRDKHEPTEEH